MRGRKGSALITGAAKRIGKSIALALAEYGYDIGLHYNTSSKEAETTAAEIRKIGGKVELFKADLNDLYEVENLAREASGKLKNYNLLVNNASIFERISFMETTPGDLSRNFNINFAAPFFLSQNFAKNFSGENGNIINITDSFVSKNRTSHFAYMLAKKSLYDFTKMAAKDLAPNIKVNSLALGLILPSDERDEEYKRKRQEILPLKKISSLSDINNTIKYILETDVTGQCFFLDGGEVLL